MDMLNEFNTAQAEALDAERPVPDFAPGDTVRVNVKVVEGSRERVQAFEGVCIARRNRGLNTSFTVRKISYGEGVERIFQLYSRNIAGVEVVRRGVVRRLEIAIGRARRLRCRHLLVVPGLLPAGEPPGVVGRRVAGLLAECRVRAARAGMRIVIERIARRSDQLELARDQGRADA